MSEVASSQTQTIRVLLVEDYPTLSQGMALLLSRVPDITVVGVAQNGQEAVERCRHEPPDVVLMDVGLPVMDGFEATRVIKCEHPEVNVLIYSVSHETDKLGKAREAGASGYVLKNASPRVIVDSIKRVRLGEMVFAPEIPSLH